MKAAYIEQVGPPENIRYGELPTPAVTDRGVLVEVSAVAVDPIDTYIRSGAYRIDLPLPFVLGRDMTGIVREIGAGVTRFRVGDRVWCNNQGYAGRQGTFAELVAIDEALLYPLPAGVDPIDAVAVVHSALTAVAGLTARAKPKSGESIFINGGDGNVGTAVLQLARSIGCRVAVTSSSEEKAAWCRELGADAVIDYKHQDVHEAVSRFAPDGVDIYWDATGKPDVAQAVNVLAHRGRIVLMSGLKHESTLPVGAFYTRNCTMFGFTVTDATVDELTEYAREINDALARGVYRANVNRVLPLSQAAEAHRLVEQGKLFGKVVLVPER
jgi:NADPH2:quinone reductase